MQLSEKKITIPASLPPQVAWIALSGVLGIFILGLLWGVAQVIDAIANQASTQQIGSIFEGIKSWSLVMLPILASTWVLDIFSYSISVSEAQVEERGPFRGSHQILWQQVQCVTFHTGGRGYRHIYITGRDKSSGKQKNILISNEHRQVFPEMLKLIVDCVRQHRVRTKFSGLRSRVWGDHRLD